MLYKWPQGKFVRGLMMLLAVVIAVDLGYEALVNYELIGEAEGSIARLWAMVAIFGAAAVIAGFGGLFASGVKADTSERLIEVEQEMVRVTWPTAAEVLRLTITITIVTFILAVLIYLVDLVNYAVVVDWLLKGR